MVDKDMFVWNKLSDKFIENSKRPEIYIDNDSIWAINNYHFIELPHEHHAYHIKQLIEIMSQQGWVGGPLIFPSEQEKSGRHLDGGHRLRATKYLWDRGIEIRIPRIDGSTSYYNELLNR